MSKNDGQRDNPGGILVPPPLIFLGGLAAGLVLDRLVGLPTPASRFSRSVGLVLGVAGASLLGWFGRTMRDSGNPFRLDESADTLLTEGPFLYSRNPGYLSFAMVYLGISLLTKSCWSTLLLPLVVAIIRFRVIEQEERYLEREFGEEYLDYKARVRRWI